MEYRTSQHFWPYTLVIILCVSLFGLSTSAPYSQDWSKDTPWKSSWPSRNSFFRNTAADGVQPASTHPWSRTFYWGDRNIYPMPSTYSERYRGPILSTRSSDYKPRRPVTYDPWSSDRSKQNGIFGMTRYFPTDDKF